MTFINSKVNISELSNNSVTDYLGIISKHTHTRKIPTSLIKHSFTSFGAEGGGGGGSLITCTKKKKLNARNFSGIEKRQ